MGVDFYVVCDERKDQFELGTGAWGWHYSPDPDDPDQPKHAPSIERLLVDELHRDDRGAFAEYVLRVWLLGCVEAGHEGWTRNVGRRLFDFCAERDWKVRVVTGHDGDESWHEYETVGSRYASDQGLIDAMLHWDRLADEQDTLAAYGDKHGKYTGVEKTKAATYRRTATSLRLQISSGTVHCSVCLGDHPNHECPQRPGAKR